jgi:hypothetical protein
LFSRLAFGVFFRSIGVDLRNENLQKLPGMEKTIFSHACSERAG